MSLQTAKKPVVIGLYGLPGSGKSFLLKKLKQQLNHRDYVFYEGSEMISSVVPGALQAFQKLNEEEKKHWRQVAIDTIARKCRQSGKTAIVSGHLMFWCDGKLVRVYTNNDMQVYSHIIYLDIPPATLSQQRSQDLQRSRPNLSFSDLLRWQQTEIRELTGLYQRHGFMFSCMARESETQLPTAIKLIEYSRRVGTIPNAVRVDAKVSKYLTSNKDLETMLVVDADRTLSANDTGATFWDTMIQSQTWAGTKSPLPSVFDSRLGYSEAAFLQATLLYEQAATEEEFERICDIVATKTTMHAGFVSLFQSMASQGHVGGLVVTCGIRRVWEKILEREGLSQKIKVIGGARISDGIVVTPQTKAEIVSKLQREKHLYVYAIGDSPLDVPMLEAADEALAVVGDEDSRSRSMDNELLDAIMRRGLVVRQILIPHNVSPRLWEAVLPQISLDDKRFLDSVFSRRCRDHVHSRVWHATDKNVAKLLMSPTRDASVGGPMLRRAHNAIGAYLANEFLAELLGVEEYPMRHVQGHDIPGHRFQHERETVIVALMRGGEPMALGLNDALPLAMLVHANSPSDIKKAHLENKKTIILVDSVINSGKTLIQFIKRVREMRKTVRVVVLAGVVHTEAVSKGHTLTRLVEQEDIHIGTLRLSSNKFTGTRGTDTGHRLFNTTHMA
ncbi:hypothetical protein QQS21_009824 [Conoideocrella luteorostrata]|uniref:Phosphoribosyltransferase domain-containing protein n=1 Tax=Conoideocrella luteorostrata TaxID=1105319 RepID=A0AAJ0CGE2_9HYPO|nr:hypothetical protein QQS21_009824 [Conoideocrella luteorostrata]